MLFDTVSSLVYRQFPPSCTVHTKAIAEEHGTVVTGIEGNVEVDGRLASELVEYVWLFAVAAFEDERLSPPNRRIPFNEVATRIWHAWTTAAVTNEQYWVSDVRNCH